MKMVEISLRLMIGFIGLWEVQGQTEKYTCGSLLRELSGNITSPSKGNSETYNANLRCRWTLVAQDNMVIQLTVLEMDIEEHYECLNDYLAIYDGNDIVGKGYYCGTSLPPVIRFSSRVAYLDFVSNEDTHGKGFRAEYQQVNDPDCGCVLTLRAGSLRSADVDERRRYNDNVVCMWMIEKESTAKHLEVLIVAMDIQTSDHCIEDYLMIRGNSLSPTKHCGLVPPPLFRTTSTHTFILLQSGLNTTDSYFTAVYTNADEHRKCGGILTESSGSIVSVDFDGDSLYDVSLECVWVIVAPDTSVIELTFLYIDLEWHKNCEWDHIRIFEGVNSYPFDGIIGWFCGKNTPAPIVSKTNILYIEFTSDHDAVFKGFEIIYQYIVGINVTASTPTNVSTEPIKIDTSKLTVGNGVSCRQYYQLYWLWFVHLALFITHFLYTGHLVRTPSVCY